LRAWLAEIARDEGVERIDLQPLDETEVAALVYSMLGEEVRPAALADIRERSDVNPIFVEELLASRTDTLEARPDVVASEAPLS
jgi:predicted ATPase